MNFLSEMKWRGMIHDKMPGVDELMASQSVTGYWGADPTSDSLHVGNLASMMLLIHSQRWGHKPILLVGGATGLVGDPSGKKSERPLMTIEELNHNLNCMQLQASKFLDFETPKNTAIVVNNYDWFKEFNLFDFLRQVGKHITVNYMMAKDSVKNRMEDGLSYTEFTYQLIQGYDFYHLWKNYNCKLQFGGSDQWGNMTTGTELIRRMGGGEAYVITCPLITKADGTKFGKSEGGNIWLDPKKTSPYKFYQFWLNAADAEVERYLKVFTFLTQEEIAQAMADLQANPGARAAQKLLAAELTTTVHGKTELDKAMVATGLLFNGGIEDLKSLSLDEIKEIFEGIPVHQFDAGIWESELPLLDFLTTHLNMYPSKGEARKMIQQGGLKLNREKLTLESIIDRNSLLNGNFMLLEQGKAKKHLVIA